MSLFTVAFSNAPPNLTSSPPLHTSPHAGRIHCPVAFAPYLPFPAVLPDLLIVGIGQFQQVAALACLGYTNRQIAKELNLSARTIEGYRANLVSKLGMKSRVELMNYVEEHALMDKNS